MANGQRKRLRFSTNSTSIPAKNPLNLNCWEFMLWDLSWGSQEKNLEWNLDLPHKIATGGLGFICKNYAHTKACPNRQPAEQKVKGPQWRIQPCHGIKSSEKRKHICFFLFLSTWNELHLSLWKNYRNPFYQESGHSTDYMQFASLKGDWNQNTEPCKGELPRASHKQHRHQCRGTHL